MAIVFCLRNVLCKSNPRLAPFCAVERAVWFYRWAVDASETLSLENVKGSNQGVTFLPKILSLGVFTVFVVTLVGEIFSDRSVNKNGSVNVQSRVVWSRLTADQEVSIRNQSSEVSVKELNFFFL